MKHTYSKTVLQIGFYVLLFAMAVTALVLSIVAITRSDSSSSDSSLTVEKQLVGRKIKNQGVQIKEGATQVRDGAFHLGTHDHPNGKRVQTIVFVDTNFGLQRPQGEDLTEGEGLSCCEYLSNGIRWPESFTDIVMDTDNLDGLSDSFFNTSIQNVADEYNSAVTNGTVFGDFSFSPLIINNPDNPNGINEVYFAVIDSSSTIAHAIIHLVPDSQEIVECDIAFNVLFEFGDASSNSNLIDWESVFAHEVGHCLGLAHNNCASSTMFPSAGEGETNKRDLTNDDSLCVNNLYSGLFLENGSTQLKFGIPLLSMFLAFFWF